MRTRFFDEFFNDVDALILERGKEPKLPLKSLPALSRKIWGIRKGRLTIIAARPSQGKSAFSLQLAIDLALQKKKVAFLSLEMDAEELIERAVCNMYKINNNDLLMGKKEEYLKVREKARSAFKDGYFCISDSIGWEWQEVDNFVNALAEIPDIIFIDYIQAIKKQSLLERGIIDEYIRKIREIAVRKNIAIVLLSQINRASQDSKDKAPRLHHLKGTGFLEEHADMVMLLHWAYKYNNKNNINNFNVYIEKNRNGPTGVINLLFYPQWYRFEDDDYEQKKYIQVVQELNEDWHD